MHLARWWNMFCAMTNRFGVVLHPEDMRWAAAERVSETVIAAVLLLHKRGVDDIAPQVSAAELEQVIKLVGRSPRVYPRGTLEALKERGWRQRQLRKAGCRIRIRTNTGGHRRAPRRGKIS
jgi:hypothetical protein